MTAHDDSRVQLVTRLGASLLAVAGAASLVYAVGFTHTWAYLRFFDAAILISDVPTTKILIPALVYLPLFVAACAGSFASPVGWIAREKAPGNVLGTCVSAALLVLSIEVFFAQRLTLTARAALLFVIAILLSVSAVAAGLQMASEISAMKSNAAIEASVSAIVAMCLAIVVVPLCLGKASARFDAASIARRMAVVTIRTSTRDVAKPMLFYTAERVYSLRALDEDRFVVEPIEWSQVVALRDPK